MPPVVNVSDPVIWATYGNIVIQDCLPEQFDEIAKFVVTFTLERQLLFRTKPPSQLQQIYEHFIEFIKSILNQRCCLIAVDTNTKQIVGAIILRVMLESAHDWSATMILVNQKDLVTMLNLMKYMCHAIEMEEIKRTLHAFLMCLEPSYRGLHLKAKMFRAAQSLAMSLNLQSVSTVVFSRNNQIRLEKDGMNEEYRVYYANYVTEDGERPFTIQQKREWFVILYVQKLPDTIPYNALPPKDFPTGK